MTIMVAKVVLVPVKYSTPTPWEWEWGPSLPRSDDIKITAFLMKGELHMLLAPPENYADDYGGSCLTLGHLEFFH